MKKTLSIIAIVVVIIGFIISKNYSGEMHDVKIGAVLSLTGMAAVDGQNMKDGIEFAKSVLKKDGITLEVVYEDDGTEPIKTVSAVNKLVDIDRVTAIIGPTWSFLSAAAADSIQEKQIVSFNPANTSEHVEGKSDYFLFGAPKNSLKEGPAIEWLKKIGAKKVAIVLEQGAWGDSHIKPFEKAISSVGATLVITERIPYGASGQDIQTIVSKTISAGAEAILFTGFDASTAVTINKVQELRPGLPFLAATEIAKKHDEDGKINVATKDNVYVVIPGASQKFREDFKNEYGRYPGSYADRAYDGTMMLVQAMQKKSSSDDLNKYIRGMNYKGYVGTYSFDENNDLVGGEWVVEQLQ